MLASLIAQALQEDCAHEDITSLACIAPDKITRAYFLLKEPACVAGLPFLAQIFSDFTLEYLVEEGAHCPAFTRLATLSGPALKLLSLERTALNLLQHCSGIATTTAEYVHAARGCDILDTRKTLPGLRLLQKYAVRIGGGKNHRFHLKERFLIKNNHLFFLKQQGFQEPILEAVQKARALHPEIKIEVEVEDLLMVEEALASRADLILLDNMSLPMIQQATKLIAKRAYVEVSGNVLLPRVPALAEAGVDGISVGALTHSVKAIDISLKIGD